MKLDGDLSRPTGAGRPSTGFAGSGDDWAPGPAATRHAKAFEYYPCLGRVRDHVLQHLDEEITLAGAATIAGLEYHHFSRVFHERIGFCFREWLCALRVARAMDLLWRRDLAISSVGASVGFADRRSMQRAFQRWLGMTPREYRSLSRSSSRGPADESSDRLAPTAPGRDESAARLYSPHRAPGSAG